MGHLLARPWPDKKHRRFLRCENRCKNMLISKLNTCFYTCFPAVLNSYTQIMIGVQIDDTE